MTNTEKYMKPKFIQPAKRIFLLAIIPFMISACAKSEDPTPETAPEVITGTVPFYKVQRVENFAVETDDANPTVPKSAAYYSLENKMEIKAAFAKTARWDVGFNGLYNSFLSGNNGGNATNLGYGASGTGAILILEKSFDEVTDIPVEAQFKTGGTVVGTDKNGDFGEGTGWYLYDFGGRTVGDGSYEKEHVAYAIADGLTLANGTKLPARTIVLRTANGNFAKIKMISCYQNAFTPATWFRTTPHMFFTFEYVLVPKGSTKFEIK